MRGHLLLIFLQSTEWPSNLSQAQRDCQRESSGENSNLFIRAAWYGGQPEVRPGMRREADIWKLTCTGQGRSEAKHFFLIKCKVRMKKSPSLAQNVLTFGQHWPLSPYLQHGSAPCQSTSTPPPFLMHWGFFLFFYSKLPLLPAHHIDCVLPQLLSHTWFPAQSTQSLDLSCNVPWGPYIKSRCSKFLKPVVFSHQSTNHMSL